MKTKNKRNKTIILLVLGILVMLFTLTACGGIFDTIKDRVGGLLPSRSDDYWDDSDDDAKHG